MPKSRAEINAEYYAKNADDILYRKKQERKNEKTIKCKCGDRAQYKDNNSSRNAHFRTQGHKIWEMKQEIIVLLTGFFKYSQVKAEQLIEDRLYKKKAFTSKDILIALMKYKMDCVDGIDNYNKPKKPEPKNEVVEETRETTPINLYGSTQKEYTPPSASFDVMDLMGSANSDMEGL